MQRLGQRTCFAQGRKKARIADPARHGVQVQMCSHTRTCCSAQIQSQVVAIRRIGRAECPFCALAPVHQLRRSLLRERCQRGAMRIGHDHDVPGVVRKAIQADKHALAAADEQRRALRILYRHAVGDGPVGGGQQVAEDTLPVAGPCAELGRHAFTLFAAFR